jgi:hypothetical protein
MHVSLERFAYMPMGTLGRLTIDGSNGFFTVERPWLDNKAFESCIPQGVYTCRRYSSAKYPDTFEVCDVPERSKILIHTANWPDDVQGCIGLGLTQMGNTCGVSQSWDAMARFKERMQAVDEFDLLVTQFRPEYP